LKFLHIILFFLITQVAFAEKVEITSDTMNANDLKKEVHFIGNAKVKQLKDWIHADKIIVHLNKNNQAKMYEAIGSVTFEFQNDKGHYVGSSKRVKYYPTKSLYTLLGNAKVDDLVNKRSAKGEEITVDMLTGNSNVVGGKKKPVKFTFETEKK
jgi:lipopolysaccharide export system protein LptA